MAANSAIEWTDATVNFWWGCTKVGPGCDHCYAETWAKRTGHSVWGIDVPRRQIRSAVTLLDRLNRDAVKFADEHDGRVRRVFIQSMSDLFDLEVFDEWFAGAWARIGEADCLDIQIVTKRISAVEKRLAQVGCTKWPQHAGLMITVVNQAEADRDVPRLLALKAKLGIPWVGLSIEPMLGPINLTQCGSHYTGSGPLHLWRAGGNQGRWLRQHMEPSPEIEWVIVGGESGRGARPMHPDWARSLRDQCAVAGVPFFFKQRGEYSWVDDDGNYEAAGIPDLPPKWRERTDDKFICMRADGSRADGYGGDSAEFLYRVGKKAAGRHLDGREHSAFPVTDSAVTKLAGGAVESKTAAART